MEIVKGLVGMGTTGGAALTGQLVIALTVVAVVVLVLVFAILWADDARPPATRLTKLVRAWRSGRGCRRR
jgi:hypothetical protein